MIQEAEVHMSARRGSSSRAGDVQQLLLDAGSCFQHRLSSLPLPITNPSQLLCFFGNADNAVLDIPGFGVFLGTAAGIVWKGFETMSQISFRCVPSAGVAEAGMIVLACRRGLPRLLIPE